MDNKSQYTPSQEQFRSVLDNLLEGCQIIDRDFRYVYVNEALAKQGKKLKEELLGHTMMEMYPGIEKTEVFTLIKRCMFENVAHQMENEFEFPDGTRGWFELRIEPVPLGVFILSMDITQRKILEKQLLEKQKSLEIYKQAVDRATNHIIITDADGKIIFANEGAHRTTGYEIDEIVGQTPSLWSGIMSKEFYDRFWRIIKVEKRPFHGEVQNRRKNGELYWANITVSPIIANGDLVGFIEVADDTTRTKIAEEQLKVRNAELERLNKVMVGRELKMIELKKMLK